MSKAALLEMGFGPEVVDRALAATDGSIEAAIEWLDTHDAAGSVENSNITAASPEPASTESAPVEERLAALRKQASDRRAEREKQDRLDRRKNEELIKKSQQEALEARRDLEVAQAQKMVEKRRREAHEDRVYREKLRKQIEQDKREREALRTGVSTAPAPPQVAETKSSKPKPKNPPDQVRLRAKYGDSTVTKSLPSGTTVEELGRQLADEFGLASVVISTTFPKRDIATAGNQQSLVESELANASVLVKGGH